MNKKLFFRADAAPEIGLGHVRRCAVLAQACRELGTEVHLIVRWHDVAIDSDLDWTGVKVHEMPWGVSLEEDVRYVVGVCGKFGIRRGVIDHYRLPGEYQERLVEYGIDWMQFGNALQTHPLMGRWVHDASPGADKRMYVKRNVGRESVFLMGPEWALVGSCFRDVRAALDEPRIKEVKSILITFGGGDDHGATKRVLGWLDVIGFAGRRLVLTASMRGRNWKMLSKAEGMGKIDLHVGNWEPAEAMGGCQLAVCAGGTTLHELACLGVPAVIVTIADNQVAPAEAWKGEGFGEYLGAIADVNDATACEVLASVLKRPEWRLQMAEKAWSHQDGLGAQRVAQKLLSKTGPDAI